MAALFSVLEFSNASPGRAAYEEDRGEFNLSPSRGKAKLIQPRHEQMCQAFSVLFLVLLQTAHSQQNKPLPKEAKVHLPGDTREDLGLGFLVRALSQDSHRACRLNSG